MLVTLMILLIFKSGWAEESNPAVDEQGKKLQWILTAGFCIGGDKIVTMEFEDGKTDSIKAGELLLISGGVVFPTLKERIDKNGNVVLKIDNIGQTWKEKFKVDAYCWSPYWNINEKLKIVIDDIIDEIESGFVDKQ
ncbi:MAG: hypothetical protein ABIJ16_08615 [Bacteroidota bacterium]